jgi:hypothetical protein
VVNQNRRQHQTPLPQLPINSSLKNQLVTQGRAHTQPEKVNDMLRQELFRPNILSLLSTN